MSEAASISTDLPPPAAAPAHVGRYRICGEIASGGMASVYLGVSEGETSPGAIRAIKRVHPHLARQRAFVEMFVDEARITSRIAHPNVCEVLEWGEADGTFFLVMELLQGEPVVTLLRRLKKSPALLDDPRWARCAARLVADACAGLHAAHELADDGGEPLQIVHRDISPHNLFVTWEGTAKVVDFGVASAKHRLHHTTTGTVKGKFAYMSPEQLQGAKVDRRADVWALGVVLWELVTGRPLFRRNVESETIFAVMKDRIPSFASVRPSAPVALEEIAKRALRHDLARRTPTADAMRSELEAWLEGEGGFSTRDVATLLDELLPGEREASVARTRRALEGSAAITPRREPEPTPATGAPRSAVQRRLGAGRKPGIVVGVVLGLLAAIGGGAATWQMGRGEPALPLMAAAPVSQPEAASEPASTEPAPELPILPPDTVADSEIVAETVTETETDAVARSAAIAGPDLVPARAGARRAARLLAARPDPDDDGSGMGSLDVATPGGWAEVWLDGRRLGHTPGRFELPAGRHTLVLRPGAGADERRAAVRIVGGQLARLRVDLAE